MRKISYSHFLSKLIQYTFEISETGVSYRKIKKVSFEVDLQSIDQRTSIPFSGLHILFIR